jgi:arsenate reductase
MAEAWTLALQPDSLDPYSAGTDPVGRVSRRVQVVMKEVGIDMESHYSKPLEGWEGLKIDCVLTLCDNAKDQCPAFPESIKLIHYPVADPMGILGSDEQTMDAFRRTRDKIKAFVQTLPETLA